MKVSVAMTYSGDSAKAKEVLHQFGNATNVTELCSDAVLVVGEVDEAFRPIVNDAFAIENRKLKEAGNDHGTFTLAWDNPVVARVPA